MDHEQTVGVNSKMLDQKQQNIFERISSFWSEELQGHPEQKPDKHTVMRYTCLLLATYFLSASMAMDKLISLVYDIHNSYSYFY